MIYQISTVNAKTKPLPKFSKGFVQARNIQARLKREFADNSLADREHSWTPITPGPYIVPVTRHVE